MPDAHIEHRCGIVGIRADRVPAARLLEREIVATLFVVFNLMICGELVKIRFLRSNGFTVRNAPASIVIGLTAACALVYALAALVWAWR